MSGIKRTARNPFPIPGTINHLVFYASFPPLALIMVFMCDTSKRLPRLTMGARWLFAHRQVVYALVCTCR